MIANQIDVISLGCSKNLVDSDALMHRLAQYGYTLRHDPEELTGEIAVVNTCGFIQAAQEESINLILSLIAAKKEGRIRAVYVMGCLGERFREELTAELPEVDKIYGKYDWKQLITDLGPALSADGATTLQLHQDLRGVRPHLLLLRYPAHHRSSSLPSHGGDSPRGRGVRRHRMSGVSDHRSG